MAAMSLIPLSFVMLFLSLLGAKPIVFTLVLALPYMAFKLFPYWQGWRSGEPLALRNGMFADDVSKKHFLIIGPIVTVAAILVKILVVH